MALSEYTVKQGERVEGSPKMIKYAQYEKICNEKSVEPLKKSILRNSLKKNTEREIEISPIKKIKRELNRVIYKASPTKNSPSPSKATLHKKVNEEDIMKENEMLKEQNKELQAKISKLEKSIGGNNSGKLLFDAQKKVAEMELELKSAKMRFQENDQLIKQLLATIDYMNQTESTKKLKGQRIEEVKEERKFLFNKYELVDNHTQLGQIKAMVFDTFKALQTSTIKDNPKIAGMISFLLGKMEELFKITHNLEIKELEYLNLLADSVNQTHN